MNIVGVGAAFCMGCCPNIRNGTATGVAAYDSREPVTMPTISF